MSTKLKVLDLFSGIGGFSLGLERAGMETLALCEIDKDAQKVLKKHWPNTPIFEDIKELSTVHIFHGENYLLEGCLEPDGRPKLQKHYSQIDVICGGFPCQDISVAGKQKGFVNEDGKTTRSGLWFEFKRLIREIKPKYVIIENVANLRSNGLGIVLKDLGEIGYDSEWHIISARSIGAPHLRERIWIIAYPNCTEPRRLPSPAEKERDGTTHLTNPDNIRFGSPFAPEKEKFEWWTKATASFRIMFREIGTIKPTVCRGDDGVSSKLDERRRKSRIKQLGNSIVPQIPEMIGRAIMKYEGLNEEG